MLPYNESSHIQAVAFDVDGTLIESSIWHEMHELFGFTREDDDRLYHAYIRGDITFRDFFTEMSDTYKKKNPAPLKKDVDAILKHFKFIPGALETVQKIQERYPVALISSGFTDYVGFVADALGISEKYSHTELEYGDDGAFARINFRSPSTELEAKVEALNDFAVRLQISPQNIAFVGDSVNDLRAFEYTGNGILVKEGTEELRNASRWQVGQISEVLAIL